MTQPNNFDNLAINIEDLYQRFPLAQKHADAVNRVPWTNSIFHRFYQAPLLPSRARQYLWEGWRRSGLDVTWFEMFKPYWTQVLGGRPLWGVQDFYFLRGWYRVKFQRSHVPDTTDANQHLSAWQQPEVLYQLLHLVYKESIINELHILGLLKKYKPDFTSLLEFGCATAPILTTLYEFFKPPQNFIAYIADIKTLALHYAAFKFRQCSNVVPVLLETDDQFSLHLPQPVDAIFAITVFEHLNRPLETIKQLYNRLKPGGLLFFDYIKSEGGGLDTQHSIRQRKEVLDFMNQNFVVLEGALHYEASMPLTAMRKTDQP